MSVLAFLLSLCLSATLQPPSQPTTRPDAPSKEPEASNEAPELPTVTENVVVTATRSQRAVNELPVSVALIDEEAVKAAPVRSVDDLLREVPGVNPSIVSSSGSTPNNQRFSMRGLGGVRALALLDGIPLHDPYSGVVLWQNAPLQSLKQIEVVRGGNASLFGNYALGGTVNLITRPIVQDELSLDLSYGSWNTGRGALTFDYVINPTVALRLSHFQVDSDGYYRVPEPGPVDIPAWVNTSITTARTDLRFSDRANGFVNASTSRLDASQGRPLAFSKRDMDTLSGGFNHAVGAAGLISARIYTQNQTEHLVNSRIVGNGASEYKTQDSTIDSNGSGASVQWATQRSGSISFISLGVDLQELKAFEDRTSFNSSGAVTQRAKVGGRQRFAGMFAQASWRPLERLEVLGSARFDWFRNDKGSEVPIDGPETTYPETSSRQLDPRISARYSLGARSAIRASVYRAFNAPTLRDLYRTTQTGNTTILANPALEPETLVGGDVGWEWANGNTRVEVNLYRSEIDAVQSRGLVDGNPNVVQFVNLGTARSQGVEITGNLRLSRRWLLNGGYTFADSVVSSDPNPDLIGNHVSEVPRHAGSLSVRFVGDDGTRFEIRARAVSVSYFDVENKAVSPAHQVVDFSLSRPLRPGLEAYVLVENVFDEKYWQALSVRAFRSGLPRTITAGIRLNSFQWKSAK